MVFHITVMGRRLRYPVTRFTERDVDRSWSPSEIAGLSERELTILAARKHLKNAGFFGPLGIAAYYVTLSFGTFGLLVGLVAGVLLAVITLETAFAFTTTLLAAILRPNIWKLPQLLILLGSAAFYGALTYALYLGLRGVYVLPAVK